jgi:hypothetical protein
MENTIPEEGSNTNTLPIIWHTTFSRRLRRPGTACKVKFIMNQIPPAPEGVGNLDRIANLQVVNQLASLTEDSFWPAMCLPKKNVRLDYLLMYRAVYVYIQNNCSSERIRPAQSSIYNTLGDSWQGANGNLLDFWDNKAKCYDFVKNKLRDSNRNGCSYTDAEFLSPTGLWFRRTKKPKGNLEERKQSATKALVGFGLIEELYSLTQESPDCEEQERAQFCSDNLVPHQARETYLQMLGNVSQDFVHLPALITYCCENGIIGTGLLQKLLDFKLKWNKNRYDYMEAEQSGAGASQEQEEANMRMLTTARFDTKKTHLDTFKIKPTKPTVTR